MIRRKTRYILVEVSMPIERSARVQLESQLNTELMRQIGAQGPTTKVRIIGYVDEKRFVVRCSLEGYNEVRRALPLVKSIAGMKVALRTIKSSGTIRALGRGLPDNAERAGSEPWAKGYKGS